MSPIARPGIRRSRAARVSARYPSSADRSYVFGVDALPDDLLAVEAGEHVIEVVVGRDVQTACA